MWVRVCLFPIEYPRGPRRRSHKFLLSNPGRQDWRNGRTERRWDDDCDGRTLGMRRSTSTESDTVSDYGNTSLPLPGDELESRHLCFDTESRSELFLTSIVFKM